MPVAAYRIIDEAELFAAASGATPTTQTGKAAVSGEIAPRFKLGPGALASPRNRRLARRRAGVVCAVALGGGFVGLELVGVTKAPVIPREHPSSQSADRSTTSPSARATQVTTSALPLGRVERPRWRAQKRTSRPSRRRLREPRIAPPEAPQLPVKVTSSPAQEFGFER
jgi:hypothetical protein